MSEERQYLTVKEFAEAAEVSNKAIYQQIQGRLKDYVKVENGIKVIDKAALKLFYGKPTDDIQKEMHSSDKVKLNQDSSQVESSLEQDTKEAINALKMLIEELKQDKEDLKKDKEQLIKDKEDLKQESLKWQSLFADERKKVLLLENKDENITESEEEIVKEEVITQEVVEKPKGFIEKIKFIFS